MQVLLQKQHLSQSDKLITQVRGILEKETNKMKNNFFLIVLLMILPFFANSQNSNEKIDNSTIIKLTKSKLPESIIIKKINMSNSSFNISADEIIKLKENNVSDEVINKMIEKQGATDIAVDNIKMTNSVDDNYVFKESGIYFFENSKYTALDPTIVTSTKPNRGMFNVKYKAEIEGSESNYQLKSKKPVIYFNFETSKKSLNDANANSSNTNRSNYINQMLGNTNYTAVSPNDFKLIKLDKVKNRREFIAGKMSRYGQYDMSIGDEYIVNYKYEKVSDNTFKIIFPKELEAGEYCFVYLGNNNNRPYASAYMQNNFKVFDFGISK